MDLPPCDLTAAKPPSGTLSQQFGCDAAAALVMEQSCDRSTLEECASREITAVALVVPGRLLLRKALIVIAELVESGRTARADRLRGSVSTTGPRITVVEHLDDERGRWNSHIVVVVRYPIRPGSQEFGPAPDARPMRIHT